MSPKSNFTRIQAETPVDWDPACHISTVPGMDTHWRKVNNILTQVELLPEVLMGMHQGVLSADVHLKQQQMDKGVFFLLQTSGCVSVMRSSYSYFISAVQRWWESSWHTSVFRDFITCFNSGLCWRSPNGYRCPSVQPPEECSRLLSGTGGREKEKKWWFVTTKSAGEGWCKAQNFIERFKFFNDSISIDLFHFEKKKQPTRNSHCLNFFLCIEPM